MAESINGLLNDAAVVERVLEHVDNQTSDLGDTIWREPVRITIRRSGSPPR